VGHRKESVSEESPLLQRRFPVRGEAAAGRPPSDGGIITTTKHKIITYSFSASLSLLSYVFIFRYCTSFRCTKMLNTMKTESL
jgi:hypothetical protein